GAEDENFESFWAQYPRKVEKLAARRAYNRAIKNGVGQAEILRGAMRYAAERAGQEARFTKHPTTWLNGGCWEDEPSPAARQQNRNPGVAALLKLAGDNSHE